MKNGTEIAKLLNKKGIKLEKLSSFFLESCDHDCIMYMYSSIIEGLGTPDSDLDIYVIFQDTDIFNIYRNIEGVTLGPSNELVRTVIINDLICDVEYWLASDIKGIISKAISSKGRGINKNLLSILQRLSFECIFYEKGRFEDLTALMKRVNIREIVKNNYSIIARSLYDDAMTLTMNAELISALDVAQHAVLEAIGALNAAHGYPNLKAKWIAKIFISNQAYGNNILLDEFYKYHVFINITEENLKNFLYELLTYTQNILMEIEFT